MICPDILSWHPVPCVPDIASSLTPVTQVAAYSSTPPRAVAGLLLPLINTPLCGVHRASCPSQAGGPTSPLHPALRAECTQNPALSGGVTSTHQHPAMRSAPRPLPIAGGGTYLSSPPCPLGLGVRQNPPCLVGLPPHINTPLCQVHRASCPSRGETYLSSPPCP